MEYVDFDNRNNKLKVSEAQHEQRKTIGYLKLHNNVFPNMTIAEAIAYTCRLEQFTRQHKRIIGETLLEKVGLTEHKDKIYKGLSNELKLRLGLAQALVSNPKIVIVDEPTTLLFLDERDAFIDLLRKVAEERIVIFLKNELENIEMTIEKIILLNEGQIDFVGNVEELVNLVQGKTWCYKGSQILNEIIEQGIILNTYKIGDEIEVRFVSEQTFVNCKLVEPSLRDAYTYWKFLKGLW